MAKILIWLVLFRKHSEKKKAQLIPKNAGKHQETQDIEDANQMLLHASCESLGSDPKLGTDETQSHIHPEQSSWRTLAKLFMQSEGLQGWWGGHCDIRFALIYCKLKNLLFPWSSSHIQGGQTHIIPPWLLGKVLRIKTRRHAGEGSENRAAVATAPPNLQDLSRYGSVFK